MGFLDSIGLGSVAKVLDVGGLVKNVVDGVLPHQLASVGDLAGAVVDFKTGNVASALQHAMETVRDLPQVARGQQPAAGNTGTKLNLWPSLPHEPPPPPLASRQGKDFDSNDMLAAMKALTAALNKQGTPGTAAASSPATGAGTATTTSGTATTTSGAATTKPATTSGTATTAASTPAAGSSSSPQPPNNYVQAWGGVQPAAAQHHSGTWRDGLPPWMAANLPRRGQPVAPAHSSGASGPSNQAATAPAANAVDAAAAKVKAAAAAAKAGATAPAANDSAPAAPSTSAEKPPPSDSQPTNGKTDGAKTDSAKTDNAKTDNAKTSTGQTISSLAQLNGMSDAAIRDAVINGRISPDLLKDQGAMMVLQQRMQAIAEMNNLMTAMMRAIHDMQMAIVQNIRI